MYRVVKFNFFFPSIFSGLVPKFGSINIITVIAIVVVGVAVTVAAVAVVHILIRLDSGLVLFLVEFMWVAGYLTCNVRYL